MRNFPDSWNSKDEGPTWPIVCIVNRAAATDSGEGMEEFDQTLAQFKEGLAADERASWPTEVAVVVVRETVECIDFSPVQDFEADFEVDFKAPSGNGGGANIAQGINEALDLVVQRTQKYHAEGISNFPPLVFFFTVGRLDHIPSEELTQVRQRLEHEDEIRRARFIAVAMEESDLADLQQLCQPYRPPVCLEGTELNVARLIAYGLDSWPGCDCRRRCQESEDSYVLTLEPIDEYINY